VQIIEWVLQCLIKEAIAFDFPSESHMKTTRLHYLVMAALFAAALLPVSTQAFSGHGGGFGGRGGFGGHNGGFAGRGSHFGSFHGFANRHFFHDDFFRFHRRFFVGFDFAGFGFPYWWYPDYYNYGYYGYPYDDSDDSQAYDYRYWYGLGTAVQTKLTQLGYYHGPIDGVIGPGTQKSIKSFQQAEGQPVTGLINPGLLKALKLPAVPHTA
jgi:Putative peptidoglycan binding domain